MDKAKWKSPSHVSHLEGEGLVKGLRGRTLWNSAGRGGVQTQEQSCAGYRVAEMGECQTQDYKHGGHLQNKVQAARYGVRIRRYTEAALRVRMIKTSSVPG